MPKRKPVRDWLPKQLETLAVIFSELCFGVSLRFVTGSRRKALEQRISQLLRPVTTLAAEAGLDVWRGSAKKRTKRQRRPAEK
jgi:hypothetical protein